jgi:hypothetical protein
MALKASLSAVTIVRLLLLSIRTYCGDLTHRMTLRQLYKYCIENEYWAKCVRRRDIFGDMGQYGRRGKMWIDVAVKQVPDVGSSDL